MINRIILFSIKNKLAIGFMTLALLVFGIYSVTRLPIDAVPDITNNQVQIITITPTLATQEVEQFVTYPIEKSLASLPDLVEMRSLSRFGLSVVTVVFDDNVDVYFARQQVSQRMTEAQDAIPEGMGTPELSPISSGLGEIYQYVLHADSGYEDQYSASDLRTLQDWIVARQLIGTPGVAEVNSVGGMLKQYEVAVDPIRLNAMNVTITDVFNALEANNENTGGAYIEKESFAYFIRSVGLVRSLDDIGNIVIKTTEAGAPVLIRDVATVQFGSAVRYGSMTRNGEGEVVGGIVMMLKGENSAEVVSAVKEKIPTIQKSLPKGVTIEPFLDRTDLVNRAIGTVEKNLIEGALIVIFILVLFLGNLRAGLIVASVIPLSMLFAVIMMNLFGVTGNLMSLGAIDFGLIVDGAVIIVEAVLHRLQHNLTNDEKRMSQHDLDNEVYHSASRMMNSATFGQIIILIVYIPILTLIGIEGKMFKPMAITVSFAIIGALLLSLTYVPMVTALFLPKKLSNKRNISDRMMDTLQRAYTPLIEFSIRRRLAVIGIAVAAFIVSVVLFIRLGGEFIPTLEEGDFAFHSILSQGSSLSQSIENNAKVEEILMRFPEVEQVVGRTGSAEIPTDPMPPEVTDLMVILKDKDTWTTAKTREELQDTMLKALKQMPGVFYEASQPIQMRFNELMTGVRQDVAVKIFGENLDTLAVLAQRVAGAIGEVNGAGEPQAERVSGLPQITVEYDRRRMALYGLNVQDVNRVVRTAFAGESAGVVFENERRFDLAVRLLQTRRQDIADVQNLFVPLPNGGSIPLQQVANIQYVKGPAQISREDAKRRIVIGFNVRGRDVKSVVEDLQTKMDKDIPMPSGYYVTYGGTFKNLEEATKRLTIAVPVALLLIFVLLFLTFGSAREALLIYTAIPMSAIGGVFALTVFGMPFSISAGIGFIALFGVAVLNGIVLISTFNQLEKEGVTDIVERVRQGTRIRLRPVLMTAAVASLGFLPMALSTSAGAEVQRPLATVVIGGLITATLLTLVVLPALYIIFTRRHPHKGFETPVVTAVLLLCLFGSSASAQTAPAITVPIDTVVAWTLRNNPGIQARGYNVQSQRSLQKSAYDFGKTNVFYENEDLVTGENTDGVLKIGFEQSLEFPTVYTSQSKVYKQNTRVAESELAVTQRELIRDARRAYYGLAVAMERQRLLTQQDSLFADFVSAAQLRFQTGETNQLEAVSAQARYSELQVGLQQTARDISLFQQELMRLTNSQTLLLPQRMNVPKLAAPAAGQQSPSTAHPWLGMYQQRATLADYQRRLEANRLLPDLSVRYFNQDWYGVSPGYYGYSIGVGVPLFFWAPQGRLQSAKFQQRVAEKELENATLVFNAAYNQAVLTLQSNQALLDYYESTGLQQADAILSNANEAYRAGELSYIESTTLLAQAIGIRNNYFQTLDNYNQAVINLNYYLNQ